MIGLEFWSGAVKMMLITRGDYTGWLAYRRTDGAWVVVRMAEREDYEKVNALYNE